MPKDPWIAIVTFDQRPSGPLKAVIISEEDGEPSYFESFEDIYNLQQRHMLSAFAWAAYCITTSQLVEL